MAPERTWSEAVAAFLARGPSVEEIAAFHLSDHARERLFMLMAQTEDGMLTPDKSTELDEIAILD
jgi:hypothetical protein